MQSSNNAGVTSLIDTHCHLDFDVFDDCRGDIIATCENRNFKAIIVPGVIQSDWLHLLGICKQYKLLHAALGIHPYYVSSHTVMQLESLVDYIAKHNPIAVGEIGLDYFCDDVDRCRQVMFHDNWKLQRKQVYLFCFMSEKRMIRFCSLLRKRSLIVGG